MNRSTDVVNRFPSSAASIVRRQTQTKYLQQHLQPPPTAHVCKDKIPPATAVPTLHSIDTRLITRNRERCFTLNEYEMHKLLLTVSGTTVDEDDDEFFDCVEDHLMNKSILQEEDISKEECPELLNSEASLGSNSSDAESQEDSSCFLSSYKRIPLHVANTYIASH